MNTEKVIAVIENQLNSLDKLNIDDTLTVALKIDSIDNLDKLARPLTHIVSVKLPSLKGRKYQIVDVKEEPVEGEDQSILLTLSVKSVVDTD